MLSGALDSVSKRKIQLPWVPDQEKMQRNTKPGSVQPAWRRETPAIGQFAATGERNKAGRQDEPGVSLQRSEGGPPRSNKSVARAEGKREPT